MELTQELNEIGIGSDWGCMGLNGSLTLELIGCDWSVMSWIAKLIGVDVGIDWGMVEQWNCMEFKLEIHEVDSDRH